MKRFIIATLVALLILQSVSIGYAASFYDAPESSQYYDAIEYLAGLGILKGYEDGAVRPDGDITRAEFTAMLCRALELTEPNPGLTPYADVAATHWASGYINLSTDLNIISGYGNGIFGPEDLVTYEQAMKMVVASIGFVGLEYPYGFLNAGINLKLNNKLDATIGKPATRGMVAQILYNAKIRNLINMPTETCSAFEKFKTSKDNAVAKVTVDAVFLGGNNKIYINDVTNIDSGIANTVGRVGCAVNVDNDPLSGGILKEARVTFNYDEKFLNNANENDLAIAWYDESLGRMVILESDVNTLQKTVSVTTEHFSEYALVDSGEWFNSWRAEQTMVRDDKPEQKYFDVVFLVDNSYSMSDEYMQQNEGKPGSDPNDLRKIGTYNFIQSLYSDDAFAVVSFYEYTSIVLGYRQVKDIVNWSSLQQAIYDMSYQSATNISGAIYQGVEILDKNGRANTEKIIVLLTDGNHEAGKTGGEYDTNAATSAARKGYKIYTIGLGEDADEELLIQIANETGGKYYKADSRNLDGIFRQLKGENVGWDGEDTDGDGIPDAIETRGMRNQYGIFIMTDPNKRDTDGDGLSDGVEMGEKIVDMDNVSDYDKRNGVTAYIYYKMISDPTKIDTDRDGSIDSDDIYPMFSNAYDGTIDQEIAKKYPNTLTLTILVKQPIANSRQSVTWDGDVGHSFIRIERWAKGVNNSRVKQALYIGFYPNHYTKNDVANIRDKDGSLSRNDYNFPWTIAKIYEISDETVIKILPPIKKFNNYTFGDYIENWSCSYNVETNNCTTFAAKIFPYYGISPEPTEEHQWDVPFNLATTLIWFNTWELSLNAYGYSPADAGEDIRSMQDQTGVLKNINLNYSYR